MSPPGQLHGSAAPSVSVVIPAHNAAHTLAPTLASVLGQTLADFEAIVVDDGSTDATQEVARTFAARDPRVRIVVQANSGVADARNAGILAARAPFVAPIDADDLWHPTFLEKLHAALTTAGEDTLFAFAHFRRIDLDGNVLGSAPVYYLSGRAFHRFLVKNFVGNGSGMMFRRHAALAVGGYERRLQHEFDAPGCEDWLLQLRLAGRGNVAAVPEYLVGYRRVPGGMSTDQVRMCRSRIHAFRILFDELGCRHTLAARWGLGRAQAECMMRELLGGHVLAGCKMLPRALALDTWGTLDAIVEGVSRTLSKGLRTGARQLQYLLPGSRRRQPRPFTEFGPLDGSKPLAGGLQARRLARMAEVDRESADQGSPARISRIDIATESPEARAAAEAGQRQVVDVVREQAG